MSLAIYAAPFNSDNNDNDNNGIYSQDTLINRKKTNNKTQKRLPNLNLPQNPNQNSNSNQQSFQNINQTQNQNYNSEKVNTVLASLHSKPSSDSSDLGDFKMIPPPSSMGVENTKIKEGMTNQNNKYNYESVNGGDDDVDIQSLDNAHMNDKMVKEYYKNLLPDYNEKKNSENNKTYYPMSHINNNYISESDNYRLITDKLNYMINLLEDQQDERTNNVTEEVVLYSFLGIFIIFVVDSFARVGKYVR
jgi:hypothetical protein